jgi:ATP-binding cassette, subfamily B, bacterial
MAASAQPPLPTNRLARLLAQTPYLVRALGLVWRASGLLGPVWAAVLLLQGLLPAAIVWLTRPLVDRLTGLVGAGADWAQLRPFLLLAGLMGVLLVLTQMLDALASWIRTAQSERVRDHINDLVHGQSVALDLGFYDSADFYDHLHRARDESFYRPVSLLENLGGLVQHGITLAALAAVLLPYGIWLPAALVASTLPAFFVLVRHSRRRHAWWLRRTPDERRSWYYSWLLTGREAAAELRLFGLGRHFREAYRDLRARLRAEQLGLARAQGLAEMGAGLAAVLVTAGVLAWMI